MTLITPQEAGFFMPGEFAPHTRCWMQWPCRAETFGEARPEDLAEARVAYTAVAHAIAQFEPVVMATRPEDVAEAKRLLGDGVEVWPIPLDDSWARDSGASFLIDGHGGLAAVDWGFNAWGLKSLAFANDARVAGQMIAKAGVRRFAGPQILEGGSIHVDGEGTVLVTEQCLLNANRNPHLTRADIEANLRAYLGVETVIWLEDGLENDETDGHIDDIACFAAPGRVLYVNSTDPDDPNTAVMQRNLAILEAARDAKGRALQLIALPEPTRREEGSRGRLTMSYANFYIANGGIVAPAYDDPCDAQAEAILSAAFPDRRVVMVPALPIVRGGGTIHCITQQEPAPLKGISP